MRVRETVTDAKTFNAGAFLDKGNLVFNVKAYGAVGDGVTDDNAALQAAHDAIGSAGGKIYVPAGTYLMNSKWLISKSNIEIEFAPGAVLKAAAGAANLSVGAGGGLVHIWKSSGTQTNVYFHGAAIDLNNVAEVNALEIWGRVVMPISGLQRTSRLKVRAFSIRVTVLIPKLWLSFKVPMWEVVPSMVAAFGGCLPSL